MCWVLALPGRAIDQRLPRAAAGPAKSLKVAPQDHDLRVVVRADRRKLSEPIGQRDGMRLRRRGVSAWESCSHPAARGRVPRTRWSPPHRRGSPPPPSGPARGSVRNGAAIRSAVLPPGIGDHKHDAARREDLLRRRPAMTGRASAAAIDPVRMGVHPPWLWREATRSRPPRGVPAPAGRRRPRPARAASRADHSGQAWIMCGQTSSRTAHPLHPTGRRCAPRIVQQGLGRIPPAPAPAAR